MSGKVIYKLYKYVNFMIYLVHFVEYISLKLANYFCKYLSIQYIWIYLTVNTARIPVLPCVPALRCAKCEIVLLEIGH